MKQRRSAAFTLVELVVVLTVIGLIAGVSIPAIDGVVRERAAREPIRELARLARTVRARAMDEGRPYQIGFDREGFYAAPFFNPYGDRDEFEERRSQLEEQVRLQEMVEATRDRIGGLAGEVDEESRSLTNLYLETYPIPERFSYELMFWQHLEWQPMDGSRFERWVFQPSGMCAPIKIRMEAEGAFFEVEFHPLTANVRSEQSWVE